MFRHTYLDTPWCVLHSLDFICLHGRAHRIHDHIDRIAWSSIVWC